MLTSQAFMPSMCVQCLDLGSFDVLELYQCSSTNLKLASSMLTNTHKQESAMNPVQKELCCLVSRVSPILKFTTLKACSAHISLALSTTVACVAYVGATWGVGFVGRTRSFSTLHADFTSSYLHLKPIPSECGWVI